MPDEGLYFKICIFGDAAVGKTALVRRYMQGLFEPEYKITVGVEFHIKYIEIDGIKVTLQIWDFAGENQFRFILPSYARGSAGGIFMYDTTRASSLENVKDWLKVFTTGTSKEAWEVPLIMVGSKADMSAVREVSIERATELATEHDFSNFIECSSKSGQNIDRIFAILTRTIMQKRGMLS